MLAGTTRGCLSRSSILKSLVCEKRSYSTDIVEQLSKDFTAQLASAGILQGDGIALAVSGGVDSMALSLLASRWRKETSETRKSPLTAILIDHALRPESAEEANSARELIRRVGIETVLRRCDWPERMSKKNKVQQAAREYRYKLLAAECKSRNIRFLLTGHHSDDQIESFLLRLARCSSLPGLACMPLASLIAYPLAHPTSATNPSPMTNSSPEGNPGASVWERVAGFAGYGTIWNKDLLGEVKTGSGSLGVGWVPSGEQPVTLVRPLLNCSKAALHELCEKAGQEWVEDPTNSTSAYSRNRLRFLLNDPSLGFRKEDLRTLIAACQRIRSSLDAKCLEILEQGTDFQEDGSVVLNLATFTGADFPLVQMRVLSILLQAVAKRPLPPREAGVEQLLAVLKKGRMVGAFPVAGCLVTLVKGSKGSLVEFKELPM